MVELDMVNGDLALRTSSEEFFPATYDIYCGFPTFGVFGATCQKSAGDVFVHPLLIACEIGSISCRMNRGVCLIVLLALARGAESALVKS